MARQVRFKPRPFHYGLTGMIQAGHRGLGALSTSGGGVYSSTFPNAENPISEGGVWHHLDDTLTPCKIVNGRACGTQTGENNLDDSTGYITGFGTDYEVEAIVFLQSGLGEASREVELWLRLTDDGSLYDPGLGPTHTRGYEINVTTDGNGGLGRFKFPSSLDVWTTPTAPATGDAFRVRIVGQEINIWWNNNLRLTYTDNAAGFFATGNPGMGFFIRTPAANTDWCFESITITAL